MVEKAEERTLVTAYPDMVRGNPLMFVLALVTSVLVIGLVVLGYMWLDSRASCLTVTNKRSILRRGILSKATTEVLHRDVRNIQIDQGPLDRLLGVGKIGISSAGQSGIEIQVRAIRDPEVVKNLIDKYRAL